jgi:hypothetical protein
MEKFPFIRLMLELLSDISLCCTAKCQVVMCLNSIVQDKGQWQEKVLKNGIITSIVKVYLYIYIYIYRRN